MKAVGLVRFLLRIGIPGTGYAERDMDAKTFLRIFIHGTFLRF